MKMNTLELTQQLIARHSVSPEDAGCLELVIAELKPLGFECEIIAMNGVTNLWARRGLTFSQFEEKVRTLRLLAGSRFRIGRGGRVDTRHGLTGCCIVVVGCH